MDKYFFARKGYEGYARFTGGLTFDGRKMPTWDDLPDRIKDAWRSAIKDVLDAAAGLDIRAELPTLPPLDWDPDSTPTPCETPDAKHDPKRG